MSPIKRFLSFLLLLCILPKQVIAFSSRAGHCDSGDLGGKKSIHGETGSGLLSDGNLQVKFNSTTLETEKTHFIDANKEYVVTLDFSPLEPKTSVFKGFLFRVSGVQGEKLNGTMYARNDQQAQVMTIGCDEIISALTHTNQNDKSHVEFNFKYPEIGQANLVLEVTVVVNNQSNNWYYEKFNIDAIN
jgi:hypothetical protein